MIQFIQVIQNIVLNILQEKKLTDYATGTVISIEPLKVKLNDKIILPEVALVLTEGVIEKCLDLNHLHQVQGSSEDYSDHQHGIDIDSQKALTGLITITEGLQKADKVIMLRLQGGQQYLILSKIREKHRVVIDKESNWKWS